MSKIPNGHIHPITWTIREVVKVFSDLGFSVVDGPEIELAEYNFEKLNFPPYHPARDMQDTLWLDQEKLLRTQTSPVQIRVMEENKPPVRFIAPGRVYRNERSDATHEINFYQVEGLCIDKNVTMANLLGTLELFAKKFFDENTEVQFRPSFFPFTEPSLEMAVKYRGKWIELMGAGMVHPEVIKNMGLNPEEWSGFAFGLGLDRFVMTKYNIPDIRMIYGGDYRVLSQFPGIKETE